MIKNKGRDIKQISPADRSAMLWLTVDDVLERLAVSRSKLWWMVKKDEFPPPYIWRGRSLWTQADLKEFIQACVRGTNAPEKSDKTPITWDAVKGLLASKTSGLTNKQIAYLLNADEADTANLTRVMAKSGEINVFKPVSSVGGPNFFTIADEGHDVT